MEKPMILDESELVLRLAEGDDSAFEEIYNIFAPQLIEFASGRLHSLEAAKDIIQDLFVHFWKERENITIEVSLRGFLFAATRYRVINYIRRNSLENVYKSNLAKLPDVQVSPEDEVYAKDLESKLHEAIHSLPPKMRAVFRMSRFEHLTIEEIAIKTGTSKNTVRNQLVTAISQLRSKLARIEFILWWL